MHIAFYDNNPDIFNVWKTSIEKQIPDATVSSYLDYHVVNAEYALVWEPPDYMFRGMPNLKAIFNMGAGVESLMRIEGLPKVPIIRLIDSSLKESMFDYVDHHITKYKMGFDLCKMQQMQHSYKAPPNPFVDRDPVIGIVGLGQIGRYIFDRFNDRGVRIFGFKRTPDKFPLLGRNKFYSGAFDGQEFQQFCAVSDIIVNVLPLTPETERFLNKETFSYMQDGTCLINIGRGEHVVNQDLMEACWSGKLRHCTLDVTDREPLHYDHNFWNSMWIDLTPHIAGRYDVDAMVRELALNIEYIKDDDDVETQSYPERGY